MIVMIIRNNGITYEGSGFVFFFFSSSSTSTDMISADQAVMSTEGKLGQKVVLCVPTHPGETGVMVVL